MGTDPWERLSEDHVPAKGEVEQDRRCGEADGGAGPRERERGRVEAEDLASDGRRGKRGGTGPVGPLKPEPSKAIGLSTTGPLMPGPISA